MAISIFLVVTAALVIITIYFSLKKKNVCPDCHSNDVLPTGNKRYKENPAIAVAGSPDSYRELEYKCSKCGSIFWIQPKAIIFN
jgi:uncharacterized protein with PIN domain